MATIDTVLYRGVGLSQGSICTIKVHLGLSEVAHIEGCPRVRSGLHKLPIHVAVVKKQRNPAIYFHLVPFHFYRNDVLCGKFAALLPTLKPAL